MADPKVPLGDAFTRVIAILGQPGSSGDVALRQALTRAVPLRASMAHLWRIRSDSLPFVVVRRLADLLFLFVVVR
jgi:hypothetical protein